MALNVGTNSYVTVAEADTYLTDRMDTEEWFATAETAGPGVRSKETYLVSAYNWLRTASTLSLPETSSDDAIKQAQIEAAFYLLEHYTALNARRAVQAQGVESSRLSKKWESYVSPTTGEIPSYILGGISEYAEVNSFAQLKGEYDD